MDDYESLFLIYAGMMFVILLIVLFSTRYYFPKRLLHSAEIEIQERIKIQELCAAIGTFKESFLKLEENQKIQHAYLSAISLGLDTQKMPLIRFIPVRIYIQDAGAAEGLKSIANETKIGILNFLDLSIADEFPAETGSWWERFVAKTNTAITQPEVNERLQKLERAIELKGLNLPQSEIDKNEANAISTIITAIQDVTSVTVQSGTILLFKLTDKEGKTHIHARTLSQLEMIYLEKNQHILKEQPGDVLKQLAEFNRMIPDKNHQDSR